MAPANTRSNSRSGSLFVTTPPFLSMGTSTCLGQHFEDFWKAMAEGRPWSWTKANHALGWIYQNLRIERDEELSGGCGGRPRRGILVGGGRTRGGDVGDPWRHDTRPCGGVESNPTACGSIGAKKGCPANHP